MVSSSKLGLCVVELAKGEACGVFRLTGEKEANEGAFRRPLALLAVLEGVEGALSMPGISRKVLDLVEEGVAGGCLSSTGGDDEGLC